MSRYPDITPELLKRILPALRMLVRFPAMPAQEASTKTSIELNEIYAYTTRRGRPKEKDLEVIEAEIDEGVAPKPAKLARQAPAPAAKPAPAVAAPKPTPPVEAATPDANFGGHRFVSTAFRKYRPVIETILAEPSISQLEACRRNNVEQSTWCSYKTNFFGLGDMKAERMRAFLTWGDAQMQLRTGAETDAGAPPPESDGAAGSAAAGGTATFRAEFHAAGGAEDGLAEGHQPHAARDGGTDACGVGADRGSGAYFGGG